MGLYRTGPWETVEGFIEEIEELGPYEIQSFFDEKFDGGCSCFGGEKEVAGGTFRVRGRCWRVSDFGEDLHVGGTLPPRDVEVLAAVIKRRLDEREWCGPYTIIHDLLPGNG